MNFAKDILNKKGKLSNFFKIQVEIGAFIDVCKKEKIDIVPSIAANALPGGTVTREMFEFVKMNIINKVNQEKNIDGILLSLHGAMVLEDEPDGEGELLEAIRKVVGERVPIIATLDLHANITEKMIAHVNGLFPFDNYPHTDLYDRGYEAATYLNKMLHKEVNLMIRTKKLPLLCPSIETGNNTIPDHAVAVLISVPRNGYRIGSLGGNGNICDYRRCVIRLRFCLETEFFALRLIIICIGAADHIVVCRFGT